ncbi:recombinase family protein [Methylobacterium sp. E-045]|uniref:recombinase family protein n=1 Tax=Methylobacterium sp. E-045 TaxID=2836575 RepID=UPI001FBBEFA4|nr:recombinase family protein [Methylobacterium sp. E-045]MCJ2132289.1 recombinase family protein [Methylobacterium sp. E-045]
MTTFIAYCRVSTDKQGRSGLGLEAQQAAIQSHLRPGDTLLQLPYVEVESGKRSDRPKLQAAIERCRRTGATLLIAKLDRLARNVAFISNLMEGGVEFEAVDFPKANRLTVHILAAVAEHEAKMISERTKAALAAAKRRGTKLGGDRGYRPPSPPSAEDVAQATAVRQRKADHAAFAVLPVLEGLRGGGVVSLNALAKRLNDMGHQTPRGGAWTATAVKRVLARVAA